VGRLLWITLLLPLVGCGYHLVDQRAAFGPEVGQIRIRPLENHSDQPGLERMISDALVEEFDRRGALRPVYGHTPGQPDLLLGGGVRDFEQQPAAFSSASLVLEFEVRFVVGLDVVRGDTDAPVWQDNRFTVIERFLASADPGVQESNKEDALRRMASELAGRVHDALLQTF
jgi:hypothetical protein